MNEIYKELLLENGEQHENIARDYKKKLKDQIITKVAQSGAVTTFNGSELVGEYF